MSEVDLYLVIDIGKTHIKIHVLDVQLRTLVKCQRDNTVIEGAPYAHFDIETTWNWLLDKIAELPDSYRQKIRSVCITTHGAAAALIDRHTETLVLPLLDYESCRPEEFNADYEALRPPFAATLSPSLPQGLNLGRQLFWLQARFPNEFARATDILLLPQYWAWRFSGVRASECSSLGCHTDLWNIAEADYSSLVDIQGWRRLFPPLRRAWSVLGNLHPQLSVQLGLHPDCQVHTGIHDSNASLLRYLQQVKGSFSLLSTGTWTVAMAVGAPLDMLNSERDMLANCDALGRPVACSRFMGGREYAEICSLLGAELTSPGKYSQLQEVIDAACFALPNFSAGSGPFPAMQGRIVGEVGHRGVALATLYCALMMDLQLDLLGNEGDIFMEGSFLQNALLCAVLAQLRWSQKLILSESGNGTVQGCSLLAQWTVASVPPLAMHACTAANLRGLNAYKQHWRELVKS
jgi:sugar (pentulose or hexulose) kinase